MRLRSKGPDFQPGATQLSAATLNQMQNTGLRQLFGGSPVAMFGDRAVIKYDQEIISRRREVVGFLVVEEDEDWLLCVPYIPDGKEEVFDETIYSRKQEYLDRVDEYVYVAKPRVLQVNRFSGVINTIDDLREERYVYTEGKPYYRRLYSADKFTDYVEQLVDQRYFLGDIIFAVRNETGLFEPLEDGAYTLGVVYSTYEEGVTDDVLLVSPELYDSVEAGSIVTIKWQEGPNALGQYTTKEIKSLTVQSKFTDGFSFFLVVEHVDSLVLPSSSINIDVAVQIPIMWEDLNEAGRQWVNMELRPQFVKFYFPLQQKEDVYLAEYQISQYDANGNHMWQTINLPNTYVWARVANGAIPEENVLYYGSVTKGTIRKLNNKVGNELWIYDVLKVGNPTISGYEIKENPIVEFASTKPNTRYKKLYAGYFHIDLFDPDSVTIETLKVACWIYLKVTTKLPTLGRPYIGKLVDGSVKTFLDKYIFAAILDCCDEDKPQSYSSDGEEDDDDDCGPGYCTYYDILDGTWKCLCCTPSCCNIDECFDTEANGGQGACVPCWPPVPCSSFSIVPKDIQILVNGVQVLDGSSNPYLLGSSSIIGPEHSWSNSSGPQGYFPFYLTPSSATVTITCDEDGNAQPSILFNTETKCNVTNTVLRIKSTSPFEIIGYVELVDAGDSYDCEFDPVFGGKGYAEIRIIEA